MRVVVVGAGLGGLRVAESLGNDVHCVVLEGKPECGGRIRTEREGGRVLYEAGPWRVPSSHRRVRDCFACHGVALRPCRTEPHEAPAMEHKRGLSTWGANAMKHGVRHANHLDGRTGYLGQTDSASGSAPYLVRAGTTFSVAPEGFSALVAALARGKNVHTNERVTDVVQGFGGTYLVYATRRTDDGRFVETSYRCDAVFSCVPPAVSATWTVFAAHARACTHRVEAEALNHVYARSHTAADVHHAWADDVLGQTVTSQYSDSDWIQASYTSTRLAHFWNNLRFQSVPSFVRLLRERLARHGIELVRGTTPRMHFWETAYHKWHPTPDFDLALAVRQCVEVNARHLPRVYNVGEAFSSHQAWMEGALETADLAVELFRSGRHALPVRRRQPHELSVEGRIIDTRRFLDAHPGGADAIRRHQGETVDKLFSHIGHSRVAWRVLGSMQVAWDDG